MSQTTTNPHTIDPKATAVQLNKQIGTALAQGGAVDWSVLTPLAEALAILSGPADDPMGACRYQLPDGTPVCAQLTQSQCQSIGGSFTPGGMC